MPATETGVRIKKSPLLCGLEIQFFLRRVGGDRCHYAALQHIGPILVSNICYKKFQYLIQLLSAVGNQLDVTQVTTRLFTPPFASAASFIVPLPSPLAPPLTVQCWPVGWVTIPTP